MHLNNKTYFKTSLYPNRKTHGRKRQMFRTNPLEHYRFKILNDFAVPLNPLNTHIYFVHAYIYVYTIYVYWTSPLPLTFQVSSLYTMDGRWPSHFIRLWRVCVQNEDETRWRVKLQQKPLKTCVVCITSRNLEKKNYNRTRSHTFIYV